MRYPENISIWKEKYNSDVKEWIKNSEWELEPYRDVGFHGQSYICYK